MDKTKGRVGWATFVGVLAGLEFSKQENFKFPTYEQGKKILEKDYDFFMVVGLRPIMPKNPSKDYPLLGKMPLPCAFLDRDGAINFNVMEYDNIEITKERDKIKGLLENLIDSV